jgi:hypothetical protein
MPKRIGRTCIFSYSEFPKFNFTEYCMAAFPSFETFLLEAHQSLAPHGGINLQTVEKNRLAQLDKPLTGHIQMCVKLLAEIFKKLGLQGEVARDAIVSLQEMFGFHKALELETWTYDADERQVTWHLLAASVIPALGRRVAFWDLAGRLDEGMPGGTFWYLPTITTNTGSPTLSMPVTHVMDWLADLLGQSFYKIEDETFRKNLYAWRAGVLPDNTSIGAYFPDLLELDFQGCFNDDPGATPEVRLNAALDFITRKGLNAEKLRSQIPMTAPGLIASVLARTAPAEDALHFVTLLARRYAQPCPATIRRRLYIARMMQDGYERLVRFVCPGVRTDSGDAHQNKVLQLVWLFEYSYNLTIQAERHGITEAETNAWFEDQLAPWLSSELFLGVLPSMGDRAPHALGSKLTSRFEACTPGDLLEDVFLPMDAQALVKRNIGRLMTEASTVQAEQAFREALGRGAAETALQSCASFDAVVSLALDTEVTHELRLQAIRRSQQLASTALDALDCILAELHLYLNNDRTERPLDCEQRVAALLAAAQANPRAGTFSAIILQYEAKHQLAMNNFDCAATLFAEAFRGCKKQGYGKLRGEIARDALALAVALQPLHVNDERYFRTALLFDQVHGAAPTFEDTALVMADYFWEDFYQPYAGYSVEVPPMKHDSKRLFDDPMGCIQTGDWEKFKVWMTGSQHLKNKRLREVRGDTIISLWLKMLHDMERTATLSSKMFLYGPHGDQEKSKRLHANFRTAIETVAAAWPRLLNLQDFKGQSPLMLVADAGDVALTGAFLKAGAIPGQQDYLGRSALHAAVTGRNDAVVRLLLDAGIDAGMLAGDERNNALHTAVRIGMPAIVATLLEREPQLQGQVNGAGKTPGMLAAAIAADVHGHILMMQKARRKIGTPEDFAAIFLLFAN